MDDGLIRVPGVVLVLCRVHECVHLVCNEAKTVIPEATTVRCELDEPQPQFSLPCSALLLLSCDWLDNSCWAIYLFFDLPPRLSIPQNLKLTAGKLSLSSQ